VSIDGRSYALEPPFLVIATQNPVEHHGTYPLPESQMDRFLMRLHMGYPATESERQILRSEAGAARLDDVRAILTGDEVTSIQEDVMRVRVDDSLVEYALQIVNRTRDSAHLSLGVSPRGSLMLYRAAQSLAYVDGRDFTTPEDFKTLAVPVFSHRVVVSGRYSSTLKKSQQSEQILREIVEGVPVPM
jgi:MoxR-like ATPase